MPNAVTFRPFPPVMSPVNTLLCLLVGTTVRNVSGTEIAWPPERVTCTAADTSPTVLDSLELTVMVRLPCPGMVTDEGDTEPAVPNFCVLNTNRTGPLKPDVAESTKYADHVPAIGNRTSTWPKLPLPCGTEYAWNRPRGSIRFTRIGEIGVGAANDKSSRSAPLGTLNVFLTNARRAPLKSRNVGAVAASSVTEPDWRVRNAPSVRVASVTVCAFDDVFVSVIDPRTVLPPSPMPVS